MKVTLSTGNWIKLVVREAGKIRNLENKENSGVWLASGMVSENMLSLTSSCCFSCFVLPVETSSVIMLVYISFIY